MRIKLVLFTLSKVLLILGLAMLLPLFVALYYGEGDAVCFIYAIPLTEGAALALFLSCRSARKQNMRQREGFLLVTLVWLVCALFGSIPYLCSTMFTGFFSAFFESMSGFTTTGASALVAVEELPRGLLFWRALSHWLGGAGIVMLFVVLLRGRDGSGASVQIFNAEHSGSELSEKITPRVHDSARALSFIYLGMTGLLIVLLLLGGMSPYDTLIHTFSTVSTSGFSDKNTSITFYESPYIHWVITIFMFLASVNFSLYYLLISQRRLKLLRDEELRGFFCTCLVGLTLITVDLYRSSFYPGQSLAFYIRYAAFQTVSVISTTGFATASYDTWPVFSRGILFILMFVGGCTGSTSSSIKISRFIVFIRACRNELRGMIQPRLVKRLTYNNRGVSEKTVSHIMYFIITFIAITFISGLLLTACGLELVEALSASLACISNVGWLGFGNISVTGNFAAVPAVGQAILIFNMLVGRLELFTVLVLFLPSAWRK